MERRGENQKERRREKEHNAMQRDAAQAQRYKIHHHITDRNVTQPNPALCSSAQCSASSVKDGTAQAQRNAAQ
jgi:hypothetical protein